MAHPQNPATPKHDTPFDPTSIATGRARRAIRLEALITHPATGAAERRAAAERFARLTGTLPAPSDVDLFWVDHGEGWVTVGDCDGGSGLECADADSWHAVAEALRVYGLVPHVRDGVMMARRAARNEAVVA